MTTRGLDVLKTPTGTEPVTVEELKLHLSIDFDDHDDLLNILLKSARDTVERYTGLSLIDSTVKARWERLSSGELPYGPVKSVTNVDDYTVEGMMGSFVRICSGEESPIEVEYQTGYTDVPDALKLAIMKLAADNFEQRTGIVIEGARGMNDWRKTAAPYSRKTWLG